MLQKDFRSVPLTSVAVSAGAGGGRCLATDEGECRSPRECQCTELCKNLRPSRVGSNCSPPSCFCAAFRPQGAVAAPHAQMFLQTCSAGEASPASFAFAVSHRRHEVSRLYAAASQQSCRESDQQPIPCLWCRAVLAAFEPCVWDFLAALHLRLVRVPCRLMSSRKGTLCFVQPQTLDEFGSVLKTTKAPMLDLGQPLLAVLYEQRSARGQRDHRLERASP
ncbi:unnamed protein product [Symbiodinium sp. KB8]|nr:unnamed protein product [Symbiodinium sp. KB8]